ncbi:MAG: transposase, partial [bacterium]
MNKFGVSVLTHFSDFGLMGYDSNMPRIARSYILGGDAYHVICRGNNREQIFRSDDDFLFFLNIVRKVKINHHFLLYHYVLMTNHIHFVLRPSDPELLAKIMQSINLRYSIYYKNKYNRIGHLWQDRYISLVIKDDSYLSTCGIYIELNPVRAGIVKAPEEYS